MFSFFLSDVSGWMTRNKTDFHNSSANQLFNTLSGCIFLNTV